ncbi:MAG: hypothetical protein ACR2QL_03765 [Woeseiaceae bacterium]
MSILVRYTAVALCLMFGTTSAYATPPADDCPPMSGGNALKLQIDQYHLSLNNKKPICVVINTDTGEGTVNIKIHNPPSADHDVQAGDVTAGQKADSPLEITGVNTGGSGNNDDLLVLTVKEFESGGGPDTDCGDESGDVCARFWIKVAGVGELDPKVRVVEGSVQMGHHQDILGQVVKDLGLTLEQATTILESQEYGDK